MSNNYNFNFNNFNEEIINIDLNNNFNQLLCKTSLYTLKFDAIGDCYSSSFFKIYLKKFSFLIGKIIKNINEIDIPFDYDYFDDIYKDFDFNTTINNHLYQITFKNSNDIFHFLLINYSNGNYDGWIDINIIYN